MSSIYVKNLIKTVIEKSVSKSWNTAVLEWEIDDVIEDEDNESSCICGKENIRYLFTIKNINNQNTLFPIGSSCIKKFDREDLNELTLVNEKLFKLFHGVKANEFITLNSEYFSRKILKYIFDQGAFTPNKYNNFNGDNDYNFMLKMFNMRGEPSEKQLKKIRAIIVTSIKPYLIQLLNDKVVKKSF
ncbi:hypothetical protein [Peribacillus sp. TH27]|uniref:hypothetical protein n=1 Tax=Peribacillus sp. TH27 TaxID=2798484 RepID=UPI00191360DF|nr:hypothetical protein [Peribacillus sp. TH27]MBK5458797.1 hypothetical protein [Peribacillus sp. TH27]